ncbi:arylsulfatase [Planctomyces sp. SH-PL14]|uniref:arylsulfatase n=1 Tax=Planctomyces sp. SH-PL14 TaxID=1632864 RepID=UPI00078ED8B1|nr:arylsulfatase [Planctomyces sp. SH-PL14]AMV20916.1 Arylsulfatase [Planctomyces sp. SH-PL14]
MRIPFPTICLALIAAVAPIANAAAAAPPRRPNVIVILGDDMGYSDIGCYGGEIQTPNLDALAAGGVRFTQFYNTARCCPTRASLLTGLYPHQAGIGHMTNDRGHDGYRGTLNRESVTIAEVLRTAGYRTYMCGKWHVTEQIAPNGDKSNWPVQRGFDKFYGTITGAGSFYDPTTLCRQNQYVTPVNDPEYRPETYYYTDALSDNAVRYLAQHHAESADKPFFLYLAYTAAHWPMHALEKDIARYRGRFDDGYQPHRAARLERMKASGLVPQETPLSPPAEDWSAVSDKAWEARCMEVFAAMVDNMDAGIGRIVSHLKETGEFDNTIILFLQDNGGCAEVIGRNANGNGPSDLKPLGDDGLQPKILPPMQTRDGRWVKTGPGVLPGPADTYIAYGRGWANVSNTPFREYKRWVHEGGISTPLVMSWPAAVAADRKGALERQPGHLIDVMATCVDVANAAYPAGFDGHAIKPREGVSLVSAFHGRSLDRPQPLFWEHEGNRAVRDGRWKLVAKENQPWELYDIDRDRTESNNLAAAEPERARTMAAQWDAYAARANVLPLGTWRGAQSAEETGPSRRRFELKAGDKLNRAASPAVGNRGLRVTAKVEVAEAPGQGVIVAQGGAAIGFALYLVDGKPVFRVRADNQAFDVSGAETLKGPHTLEGLLTTKGRLTLSIDGQEVGGPVAATLIDRKPLDGLEVGRDAGGAVGLYEAPNPFSGRIESVVIEVLPQAEEK